MQKLIHKVFDFLFPDSCLGCNKTGIPLCQNCISNIPTIDHSKENFVCVFSYKNKIIKKSLWNLKYFNKQNLAKIFASTLNDKVLEDISEKIQFEGKQEILIVPIPTSKTRRREKEANQSELLAKSLAKIMNAPYCKNALVKVRETKRQVETKNREERLRNLLGAFEHNSKIDLKDKLIILVDDITTTGATLNEGAKILYEAGAKNVLKTAVASA